MSTSNVRVVHFKDLGGIIVRFSALRSAVDHRMGRGYLQLIRPSITDDNTYVPAQDVMAYVSAADLREYAEWLHEMADVMDAANAKPAA